jgi:hypothetical protein
MTEPVASPDLIVVGGGILGLSIAYHYSRLGRGRVVVLERQLLASAATSRAAALLTQARSQPALIPLVRQTYRDIADLEQVLDEPLDLHQVGSLHLAASADRARELRELAALNERHGVRMRWLDPRDLPLLVPWLNAESVQAALFNPDDGYIDPYRLAQAYARAARQQGAILTQNVAVQQLLLTSGQVTGVRTTQGDITPRGSCWPPGPGRRCWLAKSASASLRHRCAANIGSLRHISCCRASIRSSFSPMRAPTPDPRSAVCCSGCARRARSAWTLGTYPTISPT